MANKDPFRHDIEICTIPSGCFGSISNSINDKLALNGYGKAYAVGSPLPEHNNEVTKLTLRGSRIRKDVVNSIKHWVGGYIAHWAETCVAISNEQPMPV